MPVLLFDSTSAFHSSWAGNWQRADPKNRVALPLGGGSHEQLRDEIVKAIKLAGTTAFNELILAVGHGGGTQDQGTVDLAPNIRMRLARGTIGHLNEKGRETFYDPFYDVVIVRPSMKSQSDKSQDQEWVRQKDKINLAGAKFRLARSAIYESIGTAIRASNVTQVTFMTCNIGNATEFIKKIALDWQVKIKAYQKFIIFQINAGNTGKTRAFFEGDKFGSGSNVASAESELPATDFVIVGPPLTPPQPPPPPIPPPPPKKKKGQKRADSSPWIDSDGVIVHPNAPAGAEGPGRFRTAGVLASDLPYYPLPHPQAPAARMLDPIDIEKFARRHG
jgi:hypothetical protein